MLLHVGRRIYPDGGAHRRIMAANGIGDAEIDDLTALPSKFAPGQVVALLEVSLDRTGRQGAVLELREIRGARRPARHRIFLPRYALASLAVAARCVGRSD